MKTTFRVGLTYQIAGLLLLWCYLAASDGRAADKVTLPPEGSDAIVSEARLSLAEARKTQSDPRTAVGHYLDAADAAVRSMGVSSGNEVTEEARSIYNAASQEVTVLLQSSAGLWNRTETVPSRDGIYQLRFATRPLPVLGFCLSDRRSDSADRAQAQGESGASLSTLSQNKGHGAH